MTSTPEQVIAKIREAYDKVASWPEDRMSAGAVVELGPGFLDLLALRNLVPALLDRVEAAEAERDALRKALTDVRGSIKNARGAVESNQVVDKDVHGTLSRAIRMIDAALQSAADTPAPPRHVLGWTGNKCEPCKGHGVRMQDGEERRCPDCAGTGDEYGALSDPADEINPYEQALRDAVEPFLDWLEQREEGAHIKEVREGLIGVEDVIPDDHVVLGAHLRAQKDQGVLTIGHFRRLQAAYDGNASPSPQTREPGISPLSPFKAKEE